MSAKKKESKTINQWTKSPRRLNVRNQEKARADDIRYKVNELMNRKVQSPLLKEITAHADVSAILKEPGDVLQEDIEEDSFNPPLHSTAVYTDDSELLQTNENPDQIPEKVMSPPVLKEKSVKPKSKPGSNTEHAAQRPDTARPKRTPQKKASLEPEPGSSTKHGTPRNLADKDPTSKQAPKATPKKDTVPAKTKTQRKEQSTSGKKKSRKDKMETTPADIWSPENLPKTVRSVTELDVILFESGKLIELYRENIDTDVCKKAVDVFFQSFKEQLTTTISDVRKLKDLKRKNAKMQSEIGKKRKRLIEVKDEIITKQPELYQLQKECSEMEKKQDSLTATNTFLDNLAQLKEDYLKYKIKNPHVKETHGISSLPALCLETENVLKAEQHFHAVNRQLQSFIDKEKGDG